MESIKLAAISGNSRHFSSLSAMAMNSARRLPKASHSSRTKSSAATASAPALLNSNP